MIPAQVKQALKSRTVQYGVGIAVLSVLQGFVGFFANKSSGSSIHRLRNCERHRHSSVYDDTTSE